MYYSLLTGSYFSSVENVPVSTVSQQSLKFIMYNIKHGYNCITFVYTLCQSNVTADY